MSDLRYEVMFLLDGSDEGIPALREAWGHVGDSIVVVGGDGLWNCHIHTDEIGQALEMALEFGRPRQIRITDLLEQVDAEHGEGWATTATTAHHLAATAVVAVVNGDGLSRLYRSLGVQELVVGGQSMNPSVAELLHAVETANSEAVIILPNNKNIHSAARQVDELTTKSIAVIPTISVVEGLSALIGYDPATDIATNVEMMEKQYSGMAIGEITQAVRKTTSHGLEIKKGDWLGLDPTGIKVVAPTIEQALAQLADKLVSNEHELLTVIQGEGATPAATASLRAWVEEHRPNVEFELQEGGQPLYPYLFGAE